jgi:protein gp37
MADKTKIKSVNHTQNLWIGCTKVSEGCKHCYAEAMDRYWRWTPDFQQLTRTKTWGQPANWQRAAKAREVEMVFGNSLSDFFHPRADQWRPEAWELIKRTPNLIWRLTTKRPELIADRLPNDWGDGYKNVWIGATVEMKKYLWRLDSLRDVPAVAHYLAAEPLLGDLTPELADHIHGIDWVMVGGESGAGFRPMDAQWARNIQNLCQDRRIAFWFNGHAGRHQGNTLLDGKSYQSYPAPLEDYKREVRVMKVSCRDNFKQETLAPAPSSEGLKTTREERKCL